MTYFGIDVHSKYSEICGLSESGEVEVRTRIATTEAGIGGNRCHTLVGGRVGLMLNLSSLWLNEVAERRAGAPSSPLQRYSGPV